MLSYSPIRLILAVLLAVGTPAAVEAQPIEGGDAAPAIVVRNNHPNPYNGPLTIRSALPPGKYWGAAGRGIVQDGTARMVVSIPAHSEIKLARTDRSTVPRLEAGPYDFKVHEGAVEIRNASGATLGRLDFGFVVILGDTAGPESVAQSFDPLELRWQRDEDGRIVASVRDQGYLLDLELSPFGDGWLEANAVITPENSAAGDAYVALVRRFTAATISEVRMRWNGRLVEGPVSPTYWERDFWYTRGVDWTEWQSNGHDFTVVNAFTPSPIIVNENGERKVVANHFYVWERVRSTDESVFLISEIAGPNPEQVKSGYMPVRPYTQPSDTLRLAWQLAVNDLAENASEDVRLYTFAGHRSVTERAHETVVDLGVPHVEFGTSYFPYSTFNENFNYYRVPELDRETWWSFSPTMWRSWREFVPQMRTDLRIIRAMGFEWVRLHYLGHLTAMPRQEALDFLDFYMGEARRLGLKVLADSEGPAEWLSEVAGRYANVLKSVELENEILIMGIEPGDAERWTEYYHAVKDAAPETEVFLTGAGANGMFEALLELGVPFDRVGLHAYKHGPEGKDAFSSHALGTGGYAASLSMQATLGEFNWKSLTRLSPENRRREFRTIYNEMLEPRAIPQFFQFHFQETVSVNPSISRSGIRHYETISLDRRPKPEAEELIEIIQHHARPDLPERELQIAIPEIEFVDGRARSAYSLTNNTDRPLTLTLRPETFAPIRIEMGHESSSGRDALTSREIHLGPGETHRGGIALTLEEGARLGTYHHFLVAAYEGKEAYGWGVAAYPGEPEFEPEPIIGEFVAYPAGSDMVEQVNWTKPLVVAFGPEAPWLEMEMAYIVANTLQSATGRKVHLSSTADTPADLLREGTLILVGTPAANPLIDAHQSPVGQGVIRLQDAALVLSGSDSRGVQAAATEFVLRFWKNAKDSAIRKVGMEPGAVLGNKAGVTNPDPP